MPSIAFLLAIFIFFGAFLFAPKKEFSENEKRILSEFPEVSFGEAFQAVHETIALNGIQVDYIKDLLFLYGFTILGAFSTIRGLFKKQ